MFAFFFILLTPSVVCTSRNLMTSMSSDGPPPLDFPLRSLAEPHPKSSVHPEFLGSAALLAPENRHRPKAIGGQHVCLTNTDCPTNHYCDDHYSRCRRRHQIGTACRYDGQCDSAAQCDQGYCLPRVEEGKTGARCNPSIDSCDPGLCCAASFGQHVCKPRLQLSDYCYLPDGRSEYLIQEMCPCDVGLVCAQIATRMTGGELSWLSEWNIARKYRCVPQ